MISKEIPMLRKFAKELDPDTLMMQGPPWLFLDSVTAPKGEVQRVDKDQAVTTDYVSERMARLDPTCWLNTDTLQWS